MMPSACSSSAGVERGFTRGAAYQRAALCQSKVSAVNAKYQFYVLVAVSFVVFVGILKYVLRHRNDTTKPPKVMATAAVVVLGGMLFARFGAQGGIPWWVYYTVPMLLTVLLPPIVFAMTMRETLLYIVLAFLSAPAIHTVFSFFFGWREYMPFLHIPSVQEIFGAT